MQCEYAALNLFKDMDEHCLEERCIMGDESMGLDATRSVIRGEENEEVASRLL